MFHSAGSMRRVDSRLFCCSTRTLLNHATFSFGRLDAAAFSLVSECAFGKQAAVPIEVEIASTDAPVLSGRCNHAVTSCNGM